MVVKIAGGRRSDDRGVTVAAIILLVSLTACGKSTTQDQAWLNPGDTATLNSRVGADGLGCPGTEQGFQDMYDAIGVKDTVGYNNAVDKTGGTFLQAGEDILEIKIGGGSHIQIRITSGPHNGVACWTDEVILGPDLKNIHHAQ